MLKASYSEPQLYHKPSITLNPAVITVSKVDREICERALSRSGNLRDTLSAAAAVPSSAANNGGRNSSSSNSGSSSHNSSNNNSANSTHKISVDGSDKGSSSSSTREAIREAIRTKRQEVRQEQERLGLSLTTALCKSEEAILQSVTGKRWMEEVKDLSGSFGKIPPITSNKKVCEKGQSFYLEM